MANAVTTSGRRLIVATRAMAGEALTAYMLNFSGVYVVPSRQIAYRIPASFLVIATMAMLLPRRSASLLAHCTNGSSGRDCQAHQQAWHRVQRTLEGPALVIDVLRCRCELECSPGVSPR